MSRDRFGIKLLFYSINGNSIVFVSGMKAITPCLDKVEVNQKLLNFYRIFHLIKGINRFPTRYNADFRDGQIHIKRYWNTLDYLLKVPKRYEEQVEMFRELFLDACRL